jgi:hypothetical protein
MAAANRDEMPRTCSKLSAIASVSRMDVWRGFHTCVIFLNIGMLADLK